MQAVACDFCHSVYHPVMLREVTDEKRLDDLLWSASNMNYRSHSNCRLDVIRPVQVSVGLAVTLSPSPYGDIRQHICERCLEQIRLAVFSCVRDIARVNESFASRVFPNTPSQRSVVGESERPSTTPLPPQDTNPATRH